MILAIDPARMAAFIAVTGLTSLAPGPQMVFVMTQAAWRGHWGGLAALIGAQMGAIGWFVLAGLGLGGLAATSPQAFRLLALSGAGYLAWLGLVALRASGAERSPTSKSAAQSAAKSRNAFRDGLVVSLSNPKALVYVVALLPPFVRPAACRAGRSGNRDRSGGGCGLHHRRQPDRPGLGATPSATPLQPRCGHDLRGARACRRGECAADLGAQSFNSLRQCHVKLAHIR